ncbi:hypothetical protein [uncultured Aquimarina sp.]|uniref:hypothetical protein n=1 Tax=uncultured Aquimarina sp. TaxID=575652 RepID=UPI002628E937|nr:hypothetical protein [uncultured Aquimarina sp.]
MNKNNNRKTFIITLIIVLIGSLGFNLYLWNEKRLYKAEVIKKNKAITEIRNVIKIVTQTHNSIEAVEVALKKDFNINSGIMHDKMDDTYSLVVTPKDWNQIDHQEIWTFMGLQIVFDKQKKFQQIDFYKP